MGCPLQSHTGYSRSHGHIVMLAALHCGALESPRELCRAPESSGELRRASESTSTAPGGSR
eukprot:6318552-Alexandrium_andersonii.AAC.1